MNDWAENIGKEIDNNLNGLKDRDIRFFRIDELKRNIERADRFSDECGDCKRLKTEISETAPHIREAVEFPGKERRRLDKLVSSLLAHMRKTHGFFPPWYHNYLWSFWGIVAGIALGAIFYIIIPGKRIEIPAFCFAAGLLIGQLIGGSKDRKIRREKKLM